MKAMLIAGVPAKKGLGCYTVLALGFPFSWTARQDSPYGGLHKDSSGRILHDCNSKLSRFNVLSIQPERSEASGFHVRCKL